MRQLTETQFFELIALLEIAYVRAEGRVMYASVTF